MKIRKLLIYITVAAISVAVATAAFAEEGDELPSDPPAAGETVDDNQQAEDPTDPPDETDAEPEETTPQPEETTPEETTTTEPDISVETDPPQSSTTTTTTAATTTQATQSTPGAAVETTTEPPESEGTEDTEETTTAETTTEATPSPDDDGEPPVTPPLDQDYNPTPGDPDDMGTILLILGIAAAAFVLILIAPVIIRKIKVSIIYKYD